MYTPTLLILLASAGLIDCRSVLADRHLHEQHRRAASNNDATGTTLLAGAIQSGSFNDGSNEIGANEAQQAKSLTSKNNFINNCNGKTLTNGLQITTGSCNGIPMGDIPAKTAMVSSIITFPLAGSKTVQADTTFNITVQMSNIVAGSFTNADATYYAAPQQLSGGKVVGHTHVTVQDLGKSLNPTQALDATQFAFFKGINDAGNGKGLLSAVVTGGLPAGNYRVCTMASASNHQPVLMPVAQRGTSDDCTKFTVVGSGNKANDASNNGSKGIAAAAAAASAVAAGPDVAQSTSESKASASTKASNGKGSDTAKASATKSANGGGKAVAASSDVASATTKANNGNGSKTTKASNTKATSEGKASSVASVTKSGKGGKDVSASSVSAATSAVATNLVQQVTVIETFFEFIQSLGGLPPSVSKNGESFAVLEQVFDDIVAASNAACGSQYETCIGFSGPGFSVEECSIQKVSCVSAASTQSASATPAVITATATLPVGATQTGSVLAKSTVSTTLIVTSSASAAKATTAAVDAAATDSACLPLVTSTVVV